MEGGSEVVKIVAAKVEDYRTGTITYFTLLFMIIALVLRLGQRDPFRKKNMEPAAPKKNTS